jgi:hypothetical protein
MHRMGIYVYTYPVLAVVLKMFLSMRSFKHFFITSHCGVNVYVGVLCVVRRFCEDGDGILWELLFSCMC